MRTKLNRLLKSKFAKNVAVMAIGTAGAQAVTMAFSPFVTRLYGPEAFGIMGTFTALTKTIIPVAALTYPVAIVLPKNDKDAKGIIKLSLLITFITALLTTIILVFFNTKIVDVFQVDAIAPFLYFIPLVIIFAGLMQVTEQWLIRKNQFGISAKASFLQSLIINASKVGVGYFYPLASVLIVLQVCGNGLKALLMMLFTKRSVNKKQVLDEEQAVPLKPLAKKYLDFPLYRAPEEFFSAFSQSVPILLLTSFTGPAAVGFYNIGRTVLAFPSRLIGQSIGNVFYPRIAQAANNGENLRQLIKKATLGLGAIGLIPFGIVMMFGPWLFEFVFGPGWDVAGEYARWIALNSYSVFMNKPSVRAMPVLSAQRFQLIFTVIRLIIRSLFLVLGFLVFKNDVVAIALFGISGAVLNLALILITLNMSRKFYSK